MTTGPDVSNLSPRDAAVALRSFPRRFRDAIARADVHDPGSGQALLRLVQRAVDAVEAGARALAVSVSSDTGDPLERLEADAAALAAAVERVDVAEWARGDRLAALREAVRNAAVAVREAEDAAGA